MRQSNQMERTIRLECVINESSFDKNQFYSVGLGFVRHGDNLGLGFHQ